MSTFVESKPTATPAPGDPPNSAPIADLAARVRAAGRGVLPVFLAAVVLAGSAWLVSAPFLTPPLGASIYVCFHNRGRKIALPRTLIVSHLVAILSAHLATLLLGTLPIAIDGPFTVRVMAAVVVALVLTVFALDIIGCQHPPAGATTVLVTYGLLKPRGQVALLAACLLLALTLWGYERALRRFNARRPRPA